VTVGERELKTKGGGGENEVKLAVDREERVPTLHYGGFKGQTFSKE